MLKRQKGVLKFDIREISPYAVQEGAALVSCAATVHLGNNHVMRGAHERAPHRPSVHLISDHLTTRTAVPERTQSQPNIRAHSVDVA